MTGSLVTIGLIALLTIWFAVKCYSMVTRGRAGAAWTLPIGVVFVAGVIVVVVDAVDTYGQSGLALFLILMFFFLPLLAGGVLGCLAGHVARGFGRGVPGDGQR